MKAEDESRVRLSTILRGNPLLNDGSTGGSGDFTVKRRCVCVCVEYHGVGRNENAKQR